MQPTMLNESQDQRSALPQASAEDDVPKLSFVTPEISDLIKAGGLGDVSAAQSLTGMRRAAMRRPWGWHQSARRYGRLLAGIGKQTMQLEGEGLPA